MLPTPEPVMVEDVSIKSEARLAPKQCSAPLHRVRHDRGAVLFA